jgi:UDP-glucose 6-dehydrogenase
MTKIAVIGTGYVGLTTGACFARMGHSVVCADIDPVKVESLQRGVIPIVELGLQELVEEGIAGGRLSFVLGAANAAKDCDIAFLCVPTPQGDDGSADLSYIEAAARQIGPVLPYEAVVVNKSTVPVGSAKAVERVMGRPDVKVVSNPEFLREGSAVQDFLKPDRVVVGCDDQAAALKVAALYDGVGAPIIVTDPASAETIKYAANAFLATKLSFINAIAAICEGVGADVNDVVVGMGTDKRIGQDFLRPGPGWGGSCFDGAETCIVRDKNGTRMARFDQLASLTLDDLEILSWVAGQIVPEFQPAIALTERPYSGDMIHVRTKMGRRLAVTADHPMFVRSGDATAIKLAGELTTDHWLPVSLGTPLANDLPSIDLTDELWEVLGLFLAEGHIATDGARRRLRWSFHPSAEGHLVEFVANYWRSLGVKTTVRQMSTTMQVSISSRLLAAWFEHVLGIGTNCYNHRIPDVIWTASESAKQALMRGLWAGDGSWSLLNGGPSVALEYGTVSPELADGMLRLLGEFGIVARQKIARTTRSTVDTHWLVISGADQIEDCLWLLEPHERDQVQSQLAAQSKRIAPTGYRRDRKGTAWVRVVEVSRLHSEQTVYSVEVDRNHTVVTTGGLVAHNCFPKDSRALLKIAHDAGYRFDLLDGVIAVNEEQFDRVADKIRVAAGGDLSTATVAVWGLTFKARTDDLRDSPSLAIIKRLLAAGATVQAYDPTVAGQKPGLPDTITLAATAYEACEGANVLAVLTEWDEFRWLDVGQVAAAMKGRVIVDARNLLERNDWRRGGFEYQGIGR